MTRCSDGNWYCFPFCVPISCHALGQAGYRRRDLWAKGRLPCIFKHPAVALRLCTSRP
ncbi:MAG: hypothetical protein LBF88_00145 [Planctomycetaceae bacterium]|nr:hypothetical protein [Planctomycetaceae bacterium]